MGVPGGVGVTSARLRVFLSLSIPLTVSVLFLAAIVWFILRRHRRVLRIRSGPAPLFGWEE